MHAAAPIYRDVVLVGGGHANVQVLRRFGMQPMPGVRLTLVTPDVQTPYSGMLPGFVSGFYSYDDCHIDLVRLARFANARIVRAEACGLDLSAQELHITGPRPPLPYDVLALNVGITPAASTVPGAAQHTIPVKPIAAFAAKLEAVVAAARKESATGKEFRVAVVGGGPSGVELACAINHRLTAECGGRAKVTLISRGKILSELAPYARRSFLTLLRERRVDLIESLGGVVSVSRSVLSVATTADEFEEVDFDACLWATQAGAPGWLSRTGLPSDDRGFMLVNECLQSDGGPPNVFGVGDAASSRLHPRPKAGVYAVRAGMPLADNIARWLEGIPLRPYIPQSTHLNLISAGDKYAVAVKGSWLGWQGGPLWTWKDWIDRKFMDKFGSELTFDGGMSAGMAAGSRSGEAAALAAAAQMRCSGCGSKVGADPLRRALKRLQNHQQEDAAETQQQHPPPFTDNSEPLLPIVVGLGEPDDAAVLGPPPPGHVTVHSIDFFRAPLDLDPFTFGAIAAVHALSDCWAMGAAPAAAMALAVLPFAAEKKVEADLYALLAGAQTVLRREGCALVGGHSSEGAEMAMGLSVQGVVRPEQILRKGGMAPGQVLVLTKAVGTGAVLAAAMRGQAAGRWWAAAVDSMLESNAVASEVLRAHSAAACTDVTGFGLLGHLAEMAQASGVGVEVDVSRVPFLPGAVECIAAGVRSSLHDGNSAAAAAAVVGAESARQATAWPLLVDPQTSGGLLGAVPAELAEACVAELRRRGCGQAAVVGRVVGPAADNVERLIALKLCAMENGSDQ